MKIYREIPINERVPDNNTHVVGFEHGVAFMAYCNNETWYSCNSDIDRMYLDIQYWLESIEITLDSEEILPVEERNLRFISEYGINNLLSKSIKALEAAELANTLLNSEVNKSQKHYSDLMNTTDNIINGLNSELAIYRERDEIMVSKLSKTTQDADERYNLALEMVKTHSNWFDLPEFILINKALTLAAYGNKQD